MQLPTFPGLGGQPGPGSSTPPVSPAVQVVALAMIGAAFLGAIVIMVVAYIHDPNATLPTAVSAILFFGLGFITHALGTAQGTSATQSTVQSTANALSGTSAPSGSVTATTTVTTKSAPPASNNGTAGEGSAI